MVNDDFVTYELAVKLKELGFDWKCLYWYHPNEDDKTKRFRMSTEMDHNFYKRGISAPTLSLAQKWLREIHHIDVDIDSVYHKLDTGDKIMYGLHIGNQKTFRQVFYQNYETYEQALSEGLDVALELLKQK